MPPFPQIKLVALDVDGTLVPAGADVAAETIQAVARAQERGLQVVLATGRRFRTAADVMERLGGGLPAVLLGGALVKDGAGATLHSHPLPASLLPELIGVFREHDETAVAFRDGAIHERQDCLVDSVTDWNPYTDAYYARHGAYLGLFEEIGERDDILLVGSYSSERSTRALSEAIAERFGEVLAPLALPAPGDQEYWYLEVRAKAVSKWTGVQALAAHLGVAHDAICVVGDEDNDLPMFAGAGYAVAMGNARPHVREAADHVIDAVDANGVAGFLDHLLVS